MKDWFISNGIALLVSIIAIASPFLGLMVSIGLLAGIDTVVGIWAAKKRGEVITSRKFGKSIEKIIFYQVGIVSAIILEQVIGNIVPIVKGIATFICFRETLSILENVSEITGTNIVKYFRKLLSKSVDETIKDASEEDSKTEKNPKDEG